MDNGPYHLFVVAWNAKWFKKNRLPKVNSKMKIWKMTMKILFISHTLGMHENNNKK